MRTLILAALLASGAVQAEGLSVNVGAFSHHFNREAGFNENNKGFGLEYRFSDALGVTAGHYFNSVRKNTNYAALMYQPFTIGPVNVGASIGVMDGYPNMNKGAAFFAAVPMASWQGERFGFNLGVIPSAGKVEGCVLFQLTMKVF